MKEYLVPHIESFKEWEEIKAMTDFQYPWRSESPPPTSFQAYHDMRCLYFRFVATGPTPNVFVESDEKLEVIHSERVEIFFKKDDALNPYYCFEIDPHGRVLDYEAKHYREFNWEWEWPGAMEVNAIEIPEAYIVTGRFELGAFKELGILKGNILEAGLYRAQCTSLIDDQATHKWISWIDPNTKEPDFHVPSSFGKFILEAPELN